MAVARATNDKAAVGTDGGLHGLHPTDNARRAAQAKIVSNAPAQKCLSVIWSSLTGN